MRLETEANERKSVQNDDRMAAALVMVAGASTQ
jgi:hypothetical protein